MPPAHPHPYFGDGETPRIFGHRGYVSCEAAARGTLENTREAFTAALAAGVGFVESDCLLTKDGRVVLVHDADLVRLFGDARTIAQVTYDELAELFVDRGGLLTLDDALRDLPDAHFNIDMKVPEVSVRAGKIIGELAPHRVLVTSFSDANRRRALGAAVTASHGVVPATGAGRGTIVRILIALALRSRRLISRAFAGIDAVQIPERFGPVRVLSLRLLDAAHSHGVEVHIWTVNDAASMRRLVALGVDGIVTDRADLAVEVLRSLP